MCFSVSGRLAYPRRLRDTNHSACGHRQGPIHTSRPEDYYRTIHSGSHAEVRLPRSYPGLRPSRSLLTTAVVSGDSNNHPRSADFPNNLSSLLSRSPGSHGGLQVCNQTHQAQPPSSPSLAQLSVPPRQGPNGLDRHHSLEHPRLPRMMANSLPGVGRDALPSAPALTVPDNGRVISLLGCSPRSPSSLRPLVFSGAGIPHQCPKMRAVRLACQGFLQQLRGRGVSVFTANTTAMCYINNLGGTWSSPFCQEAIHLWDFCIAHSINLVASFLPGVRNALVLRLSRSFLSHEWSLCPDVMHSVFQKWRLFPT
ncbi:uncharacterized protein LOC127057031 [Gopherus flavomarginatus]|uniref:uncharacterized protein LOC127057031 n=1 Tax=Gopherus flavomarginatus TaxID=286002 RepID=UPI0021CC089C|nr:uncharacterized protein LOC127057031 [Gopherus flavomarginatus]